MLSPLPYLEVCLGAQQLRWWEAGELVHSYPVSTAANGAGERFGSGCTPRGRHRIRARIGLDQPPLSVFVGRRPTGEVYSPKLAQRWPERDWVLSRILWLGGLEPGRNRYGAVDSQRRFIYIHGTNEEDLLGQCASHGCIRMANTAVIELAQRVWPGMEVHIVD
jgi:lipoprotein-anchoring transpeptidase ErfK/SrfK